MTSPPRTTTSTRAVGSPDPPSHSIHDAQNVGAMNRAPTQSVALAAALPVLPTRRLVGFALPWLPVGTSPARARVPAGAELASSFPSAAAPASSHGGRAAGASTESTQTADPERAVRQSPLVSESRIGCRAAPLMGRAPFPPPFAIRHSPFAIHHSPFTIHYRPFTARPAARSRDGVARCPRGTRGA